MESSQIDTKALIAHLSAKWQGRPCQMCGIGKWGVQEKAYELREFNSGNFIIGGPILPVVPVVCSNCGNTVLVSAIVAGVLTPGPEKVEAKS